MLLLDLVLAHEELPGLTVVVDAAPHGRAGTYPKAGQVLVALGVRGSLADRRSRAVSALSGAVLLAASAATRFGIFHAGLASANDPKYTVIPQRERLRRRSAGSG